jgi:hypothetical protein
MACRENGDRLQIWLSVDHCWCGDLGGTDGSGTLENTIRGSLVFRVYPTGYNFGMAKCHFRLSLKLLPHAPLGFLGALPPEPSAIKASRGSRLFIRPL